MFWNSILKEKNIFKNNNSKYFNDKLISNIIKTFNILNI